MSIGTVRIGDLVAGFLARRITLAEVDVELGNGDVATVTIALSTLTNAEGEEAIRLPPLERKPPANPTKTKLLQKWCKLFEDTESGDEVLYEDTLKELMREGVNV